MNHEEPIPRVLTPPAGGLSRLQISLDQRDARIIRSPRAPEVRAFVFAASVIVAAIVVIGVRMHRETPAQILSQRLDSLLNPAHAGATAREYGIVEELPSHDPDVRIIVSAPLSHRDWLGVTH